MNCRYKFIYLLLMTILFTGTSRGQYNESEYLFNQIDNRSGLAHNRVYSILKDHNGFIWFGTANGLSKYDGYKFKNIYSVHDDSTTLSSNYIIEIAEDKKSRIWINADGILNIYDLVTEKIIPRSDKIFKGLPEKINDIHIDNYGNAWIASLNNGLYKYDITTEKALNVTTALNQQNNFSKNITGIYNDTTGNIYTVDEENNFNILDNKTLNILYTEKLRFPVNQFFKLFIDRQQMLWIYSLRNNNGLFYSPNPVFGYGGIDPRKINTNIGSISSVAQDNNGLIWIGTDHGGLNIYNKKTGGIRYVLHDPYNNKSLCQNSILAAYCDNEGIMWLGSYKKGVSYYHSSLYKFKSKKINLKDYKGSGINDIDNFAEDKNGNLWIGTNGAGLIKYDPRNDTYSQYVHDKNDANSISADIIIGMCIDSKNRLWVGTYFGGLNYFDGKKFHHFRHVKNDSTTISDDRIWDIREGSGNRLWITSLTGGIDIFDPESKKVIDNFTLNDDTSELRTNSVFSSIESTNGDIWIATANSLTRYIPSKHKFIHYGPDETKGRKLSDEVVYEVLEDSRGFIWAGTANGLNRIDVKNNIVEKFYAENGLSSKGVISLQEDHVGNIWAATDNGLSQVIVLYNHETSKYDYDINKFSLEDGLLSLEFNHKASCKTKSGHILFGGSDGFIVIKPGKFDNPVQKQKIAFTGIEVFNTPIEINKEYGGHVIIKKSLHESNEINLQYFQDVITIKFSALNYFQPSRVKYRYKLKNFNEGWLMTDASTRQATFTNLDPGYYEFEVQASDTEGNFIERASTLKINVLSPWWKKTWFRFVIFISIISSVIAVYFFRLKNLQNSKIKLEKLIKIRTSELEQNNKILQDQTHKLNSTNQILEERQHFIQEQAMKLSLQKEKLEKSNLEMNETNTQLEERQQLVEEQAEELRAQKEELEEANAHLKELNSMKNKFFSIIAHDLKNPLSIVLGFSELLNLNMNKLPEKKKIMYTDKIYNSSKRINVLLENLLQWARTQTDNIIFEPTPLNLKNIITQAVTLISENIHKKHIHIDYENTEFFNVYADRNMVYTIVRNLISNAVKFTRENGNIKIFCSKENEYVKLSIQDDGVGMGQEEMSKLFRIDSNYSKEGTDGETGTGLGLILCKEFVVKNGGDITVESTIGDGSVFHVTLPESEYIFKNPSKKNPKSLLSSPGKSILVVEDEPTNFYLVKKFLKDVKSSIYWAKNGNDALNMVMQNDMYNIGLIFMDLMMPEMDGVETLKRIRNIDKGLPVIAQSAYIHDMGVEEGIKKGFTGILHKPINRSDVLDFVNKYL